MPLNDAYASSVTTIVLVQVSMVALHIALYAVAPHHHTHYSQPTSDVSHDPTHYVELDGYFSLYSLNIPLSVSSHRMTVHAAP